MSSTSLHKRYTLAGPQIIIVIFLSNRFSTSAGRKTTNQTAWERVRPDRHHARRCGIPRWIQRWIVICVCKLCRTFSFCVQWNRLWTLVDSSSGSDLFTRNPGKWYWTEMSMNLTFCLHKQKWLWVKWLKTGIHFMDWNGLLYTKNNFFNAAKDFVHSGESPLPEWSQYAWRNRQFHKSRIPNSNQV